MTSEIVRGDRSFVVVSTRVPCVLEKTSRFFRLDIGVYTEFLAAVEQTLRFLEERLVARRSPRANLPSSPTRTLPSVSATRPGT